MGGSASEEFLAVSPNGEDTFVRASHGDYAANVEAVVTQPGVEREIEGLPEAQVHETPKSETIDALVDWARLAGVRVDGREVQASDTLKCLMVKPPSLVRNPNCWVCWFQATAKWI